MHKKDFWAVHHNHHLPNYIKTTVNPAWRRAILQFRLSSHNFLIEVGRWSKTPRHLRLCQLCDNSLLGDEWHCTFVCTNRTISEWRDELINRISLISPQFRQLPTKSQFLYLTHAEDQEINRSGLWGQFLARVMKLHKT